MSPELARIPARHAERASREHEEEFLQKMQDGLSAGTTWERICATIELENSSFSQQLILLWAAASVESSK